MSFPQTLDNLLDGVDRIVANLFNQPQKILVGPVWFNVKGHGGAKGDGITDDTAAFQTTLNAGAGSVVLIQGGPYKITAGLTISAGTTLRFHEATINVGASIAAGLFQFSVTDVRVEGTVTVQGGGFQTPIFTGTLGGDFFEADLHIRSTGVSATASANNYLFKLTQCNYSRIGGHIRSTDNPWVVRIDRGSHHEISGVKVGPYTVNNGSFSAIAVCDFAGNAAMEDVKIHDVSIDGGGVLAGPFGLVAIGAEAGPVISLQGFQLERIRIKNTINTCDGIDILACSYGSIVSCHTDGCYVGLDITGGSTGIVVDSCTFINGKNGIYIGDATILAGTNLIAVSNCITGNNTNGVGDFTNANIVVAAANTVSTNIVTLDNCIGYLGATYGLGVGVVGSGTINGLYVNGGYYQGVTSPVSDTTHSGKYHNVGLYSPFGGVTTPSIVTTLVTNNTGVDCSVFITTGATNTVSAISINGVATGQIVPINASGRFVGVVAAGGTIQLTGTLTGTSWTWVGN